MRLNKVLTEIFLNFCFLFLMTYGTLSFIADENIALLIIGSFIAAVVCWLADQM